MLKQLTAAILLLAFMASSFCRTVIVLDYYANSAAYAKACINKARSEMHCNGKCQMMKKLDQQEKDEQDNLERKAENKNEIPPANTFCSITFFSVEKTLRTTANMQHKKPVDRSYTLFRPPATTCSFILLS